LDEINFNKNFFELKKKKKKKVEKKLNPLLAGHEVVFMHKGSKVTGTLVKKQGPFWSVDIGEGTIVNSIPSSNLSRPISQKVRFSTSASSAASSVASPAMSSIASPVMSPAMSPISLPSPPSSQVTSPVTTNTKGLKASLTKLSIGSIFKQVGVPDSPMSLSSRSPTSEKSLPGFFAESKSSSSNNGFGRAETKAMAKKVPIAPEKKSGGIKVADAKASNENPSNENPSSEPKQPSSFVKPKMGKFDSTEEKKLFGEMRTSESVKSQVASRSSSSPARVDTQTSPSPLIEKKKPMGSLVLSERPKGAFESMEVPVEKPATLNRSIDTSSSSINNNNNSNNISSNVNKQQTEDEKLGQGVFDAAQVATFRELFKFYDKGGTIKNSELLTILSQMDTGEILPPNILNAIIDKG
jgi:hypothetical protein